MYAKIEQNNSGKTWLIEIQYTSKGPLEAFCQATELFLLAYTIIIASRYTHSSPFYFLFIQIAY